MPAEPIIQCTGERLGFARLSKVVLGKQAEHMGQTVKAIAEKGWEVGDREIA